MKFGELRAATDAAMMETTEATSAGVAELTVADVMSITGSMDVNVDRAGNGYYRDEVGWHALEDWHATNELRQTRGEDFAYPMRPVYEHDEQEYRSALTLAQLFSLFYDDSDENIESAECLWRVEAKKRELYGSPLEKKLEGIKGRFLSASNAEMATVAYSMQDLIDMGQTVEFNIPNMLMEGGITLLTGNPGSGKSTLTKQMIYSIATGEPFLSECVKQGHVVMVELDEPMKWTGETFGKMMLPPDAPVSFVPFVADKNEIAKLLNDDTRLLVIDTLAKFAKVENINDYSEVDGAFSFFRGLLHTHAKMSILVLHHTNKSGTTLGSTAIDGAVDIAFKVTRDGEKAPSVLTTTKSRVSEPLPQTTLFFDRQTWRFSGSSTPQETPVEAKAREIVGYLVGCPDKTATRRTICKGGAVSGHHTLLGRALDKLVADGLVTEVKDNQGSIISLPQP